MKLTGKALEGFNREYGNILITELPECCQNALIIEYLDSVEIKILPCYGLSGWYCEVKNFNDKQFGNYKCYLIVRKKIEDYKSRTEAINAAIEKANELINNI